MPKLCHLHRERRALAEPRDTLTCVRNDDQPAGILRDDFLAQERATEAFDQVQIWRDLIGAVDGEIELAALGQARQCDAQYSRAALGLPGSRHAADVSQLSLTQR